MPRAALTVDEIESFRDSLVDVAARLFAEQGYEGVTLRAIARELSCSPMTPYRYFDGKPDIFRAVRAKAFGRFADALEGVSGPGLEAEALLLAQAEAYCRFALDEPAAYRIMFQLDQDPDCDAPQPADPGSEEARAWNALRDVVARGVDQGLLAGDVDTLAHLFWAGLHGLVSLHLAGKLQMGRDLATLSAAMFPLLLRGTRADTGT